MADNERKKQARKDAAMAIRIICIASQKLIEAQNVLLEDNKKDG